MSMLLTALCVYVCVCVCVCVCVGEVGMGRSPGHTEDREGFLEEVN